MGSISGPWKKRSVEELKDDINSLKEWNEKMARFKSKYGIAVMEKFKFIGIILVRTKNVPALEDYPVPPLLNIDALNATEDKNNAVNPEVAAINAETQKASEYIESSPSGDALNDAAQLAPETHPASENAAAAP